ncbi:cytidylyltransferase domain-containing protein [Leptospira perdikensis]|uniref:Acylneuraminate cytidylyltransferase family protein n=1 Tax=Leptospira perdikensis TaxID=2484948 RepID=A0A4R9JK44_9LEPT|nr:acylneuraminate cytidylyltransferase family protein [Leptospira perdikensis]TGL45840.1 acylneuraminate cytidylyltransferase family protein [Leptospira perdikensis]
MINNKSIVCIITARGGSKEVPGKNIKLIQGKPLIAWTVEAAKRSKYIDRVIVTTDSEEIIKVSKEFGADAPFKRPDSISGDKAKQEDAIFHTMEYLEKQEGIKYDYIVILTPTHPLRDEIELDLVIESLAANPNAKAYVTMIEAKTSPLHCNMIPADNSLANFLSEDVKLKNRQELPTYFQPSGSTSVIEWDCFVKNGSIFTDDSYAYVTDSISGHDINSVIDFKVAEVLMKEKYHSI